MNLDFIKKNDLCLSCGACKHIAPNKISIKQDLKKGMFHPEISSPLSKEESKKILEICPANGYPIKQIAEDIFPSAINEDYRTGKYIKIGAYKMNDLSLLKNASSGGIMTGLAKKMLELGIVDGIVASSFKYVKDEISVSTEIITDYKNLPKTQGSKYMPVPALLVVEKIKRFDGKVVFIGTPCQIATIRRLQETDSELKQKIKYTIGNFCGGFKDLRELQKFKKISGMKGKQITHFQFRGSGQPGKMKITSIDGSKWEYPYPNYANLTGYMKQYRCRVCIDATAELADISCGDAWLEKYENLGGNWSIALIRNNEILPIINQMIQSNELSYRKLSFNELVISQKGNLASKKERYLSRNKFFKLLKKPLPDFDGGWNVIQSKSILFEAKVYISQLIIYKLERLKLHFLVLFLRKLLNKH